MKDILKYKNFFGSVHYSGDDEIFYGKIEGISDLITFEGDSVEELKKSFINAVEDYIDLCGKNKKALFKSYKGSFNVRISGDLHKKAIIKASIENKTLNQLVKEALEKELSQV